MSRLQEVMLTKVDFTEEEKKHLIYKINYYISHPQIYIFCVEVMDMLCEELDLDDGEEVDEEDYECEELMEKCNKDLEKIKPKLLSKQVFLTYEDLCNLSNMILRYQFYEREMEYLTHKVMEKILEKQGELAVEVDLREGWPILDIEL